jgi:hypothetical protein
MDDHQDLNGTRWECEYHVVVRPEVPAEGAVPGG